jgi:hypothetical protein
MLIDAWRPIWLGSAVETGGNPDFTADVDTGHSRTAKKFTALLQILYSKFQDFNTTHIQQIPTDSNSISERLSFLTLSLFDCQPRP